MDRELFIDPERLPANFFGVLPAAQVQPVLAFLVFALGLLHPLLKQSDNIF